MDDAVLVRRFQRLGDLSRDGERVSQRDGPAGEALRQILALDQLHHDRPDGVSGFLTAGALAKVVSRTLLHAVDLGDVRMVQRREHFGFALKPREPFGILRERIGQDLQRHLALQLRIPRPIHVAHAARAEGGEDLEDAKACAGRESHGRGAIIASWTPCERDRHRHGNLRGERTGEHPPNDRRCRPPVTRHGRGAGSAVSVVGPRAKPHDRRKPVPHE